MKLIEAQTLAVFGQVLRWHAEIVSGAYRQRPIRQGVEGGGWRDLTDEEKLTDSMKVLQAHVRRLHDIADTIDADSTTGETACPGCGRGDYPITGNWHDSDGKWHRE